MSIYYTKGKRGSDIKFVSADFLYQLRIDLVPL